MLIENIENSEKELNIEDFENDFDKLKNINIPESVKMMVLPERICLLNNNIYNKAIKKLFILEEKYKIIDLTPLDDREVIVYYEINYCIDLYINILINQGLNIRRTKNIEEADVIYFVDLNNITDKNLKKGCTLVLKLAFDKYELYNIIINFKKISTYDIELERELLSKKYYLILKDYDYKINEEKSEISVNNYLVRKHNKYNSRKIKFYKKCFDVIINRKVIDNEYNFISKDISYRIY